MCIYALVRRLLDHRDPRGDVHPGRHFRRESHSVAQEKAAFGNAKTRPTGMHEETNPVFS